jgi:hypothetical protein
MLCIPFHFAIFRSPFDHLSQAFHQIFHQSVRKDTLLVNPSQTTLLANPSQTTLLVNLSQTTQVEALVHHQIPHQDAGFGRRRRIGVHIDTCIRDVAMASGVISHRACSHRYAVPQGGPLVMCMYTSGRCRAADIRGADIPSGRGWRVKVIY